MVVEKSELLLINKILSANKKAENDLILCFAPRISSKVRYSIGSESEEWKDLTNEILMTVLINLRAGKFDLDRGVPLGSYIYAITRNKIKDYFKSKKKHQSINDDIADESGNDNKIQIDLERKDLRKFLESRLEKLKIKYKEVLYLRYFEELSIAEISEEINLTSRRVSERINYALKLLKNELQVQK